MVGDPARFRHIATLAAALLAGCGRSPQTQAEQAAQTVRSWNATADLSARDLARGSIPEQFARQVRSAAAEERAAAEAQLRKADR